MLINANIKGTNVQADAVFYRNGEIRTNLFGPWVKIIDKVVINDLNHIRKQNGSSDSAIASHPIWKLIQGMDPARISVPIVNVPTANPGVVHSKSNDDNLAGDKKTSNLVLVKNWFKWFTEFSFKPQARFMNSIGNLKSVAEIRSYIVGYFELTNNTFAADIAEKVKSEEFKDLAEKTIGRSSKKINQRMEIFYGEAGSGKTTLACCNNPDAEVVLCHAGLTPDELFRGFDLEDGKGVFKHCPLRVAMEEGKAVILDEINLLNEDCRRALQALTDGKDKITINTEEIKIKPGFKVVGTMNLTVNDMTFPLPAPLVDRAQSIIKFEMNPEMVAKISF